MSPCRNMPVALRPHTGISAFFFLSRPRVRKVGVEKVECLLRSLRNGQSFSHDAGGGISCRTREGRVQQSTPHATQIVIPPVTITVPDRSGLWIIIRFGATASTKRNRSLSWKADIVLQLAEKLSLAKKIGLKTDTAEEGERSLWLDTWIAGLLLPTTDLSTTGRTSWRNNESQEPFFDNSNEQGTDFVRMGKFNLGSGTVCLCEDAWFGNAAFEDQSGIEKSIQ